ncbi:MAG: hypothetical protein ACXWJT_03110 [Xanthobacteraceae bacterium]
MRIAVIIAAFFFSVGAAHAQRYVVNGQTVQLHFFASVNPDCSARGKPTVHITQPPQHGRASVAATRDFTYFPASNVRSACNQRRVSGVAVKYTSQRGYVGSDSVGAQVIYPSGGYRRGTFNIAVR